MKKTVFAIIFILFVAACSDSGSNGGGSDNKNIASGTEGITFNFAQNNPPSSVRGSKLSVAIEYYNKGIYPVNNLVFYLHGYDPSILFGGQVKSFSSPKIEGKNEYNKIGSQSYIAQWETGINKPKGEGQFPQQLFVTACYDYKTIAGLSICIDPNQDDVSSDYAGKCASSVQGLGSSQGAPLAVTSVKQSLADGIIYLEFVVENKGKGEPFLGGLDNCFKLGMSEKNTFGVNAKMSGGAFKCEPQASYGSVRLIGNKATVYCEKASNFASYTLTPLTIELNYNYADTIEKTVNIER